MRNNNPPPSTGEPIHLRLNLILHDHSGKLRQGAEGAPAAPARATTPSEFPSETALDRGQLANLLQSAVPTAVGSDADPDIEVTLVLYV